jgi:hypothetical protein
MEIHIITVNNFFPLSLLFVLFLNRYTLLEEKSYCYYMSYPLNSKMSDYEIPLLKSEIDKITNDSKIEPNQPFRQIEASSMQFLETKIKQHESLNFE